MDYAKRGLSYMWVVFSNTFLPYDGTTSRRSKVLASYAALGESLR